MIHLVVTVSNTAELLAPQAYGPGALLRWESAATIDGTYVEAATIALVAGVSEYDIWDSAGTASTWYRTRISDAGATTFSSYSQPFQGASSLLSPEEVMARVSSSLTNSQMQDVINEQEAWLAARIGRLVGVRTETFFVGIPGTYGKLGLQRTTDAVTLADNGGSIAADKFRIIDKGSSIELKVTAVIYPWWIGPYVTATYTPNDELRVRSALFALCALAVEPVSSMLSETLGSYGYTRGSVSSPAQARAVIVASLKPRRDPLGILSLEQPLVYPDALINRRELPV